jgi:chromosome segregation ATPase
MIGDMDWPHHVLDTGPIAPTEGVDALASAATRDGGAALDFIRQAAEVVRGIEDRAHEIEQHARGIAEEATEKLQLAEKRTEELEAKQRVSEAVISEANVKIREAEEALNLERSLVKAAKDRIGQIELRAREAEAQATASANNLASIKDAIRTLIRSAN